MNNPVTWTLAYTQARYMEVALRVGGTPKCGDLGQPVTQAIHRLGFDLPSMARLCGLTPNRHKAARSPLPEAITPMPAPEPDPRGNRGPRLPSHGPDRKAQAAVKRDPVVAREFRAYQRRMRKRQAAEAKHVSPPVGNMARTGRKIPKWDDYLPPDDLNKSQRRVR